MEVSLTRLSSKGQVVIPSEMREGMVEGEKLIIIKDEGKLILKRVNDLSEDLKEDLLFAKKTEDALKDYNKGLFKEVSDDEFSELLKKW